MKFFKNKTKKVIPAQAPKEPRQLEEIRKEYNEVLNKAGQSNYQSFVYSEEAKIYNARLLELNQEANARTSIDAQAAANQVKETANGQSENRTEN